MGKELSSCGVGFVASLRQEPSHSNLKLGLTALVNLEHRGGTAPDLRTGDGSGIMTEIPHQLLGVREGDAVANLFLPKDPTNRVRALQIFEETFRSLGLEVIQYREVPTNLDILSRAGNLGRPEFLMAFIQRPEQCSSRYTFEKMLYSAKQLTRSRLREARILKQFFFTSLSAGTLVYKALTRAAELPELFPDLKNPAFTTRFVLFHRRFSTNTATAWDTAQPFRVVAHNGEINTISGNRAWAYARERALGLREDELLTHRGISDSGSVNEMIEALLCRSSIPHPEDILAILMPQADNSHSFYRFWRRAMEPWDGPALFTYADGRTVGARLDRSGFRPCRWATTDTHFVLSSEAGSFELPENSIRAKGSLSGGSSVSICLNSGKVHFKDASRARENLHASFDPRLVPLPRLGPAAAYRSDLGKLPFFNYTEEDVRKVISPLIREGKEGIGSMGDTARLPVLSDETRSLFDFFYQRFAQVTNPPLDYLREKIVTDMSVVLGRKPNIFEPKELLPLKQGIELEGPVLTVGQTEFLKGLGNETGFEGAWPASHTFDTTFPRASGAAGMVERIETICREATLWIKRKVSVFILSDRPADEANPPIPPVLLLSALIQELNHRGLRLRASFVVESGEVKETHHLAVLTGFGAAAVCPYLLLDLAREFPRGLFGDPAPAGTGPVGTGPVATVEDREVRLVKTLESGLLKVMSKMGISVFRSYQSAELFSILGLSREVHARFFPAHESLLGGLTLEQIVERRLRDFSSAPASTQKGSSGLLHNYLYQEHPRQSAGERHSMTLSRAKLVHKMTTVSPESYDHYLGAAETAAPISFRHLLQLKAAPQAMDLDRVEPVETILRTFGSGAMSFGAIGAEAQRDLFLAMRQIGGRSNSGEGGENPYYWTDGITAHTKQVASGRFGVTAEYLTSGKEIQIKIGQGAKPGEGGQLMAVKVSEEIARARHSDPSVDLISPPPMHDIYSIEDLKQLIYELRQLKPEARISVKLVSGDGIGTIAVGVAKAGADIIHVAGHDGGTGAASLSSMKHAGLPWEIGLVEVHRALSAHGLRGCVTLRVDGGLTTGREIVTAALLGAEEYDFGKLLLIAEGCIMARVCEKNTCPTGIATHDPRFKRLYRGSPEKIVTLLKLLAEDVRRQLSRLGVRTLDEVVGRMDLLEPDPRLSPLIAQRGLDLRLFTGTKLGIQSRRPNPFIDEVSTLNRRIVDDLRFGSPPSLLFYQLRPRDRAVLATLHGEAVRDPALRKTLSTTRLVFHGSAGQGFGAFMLEGVSAKLFGEANDSIGKSMSGGRLVVTPSPEATFTAATNAIIGNCALYGATGGTFFAQGLAGNRFAVRNSGATAVVEGVGMHACEYMTRGMVVILGQVGSNVGAGMTGGALYLPREAQQRLNESYVLATECEASDHELLEALLRDYLAETGSPTAARLLEKREHLSAHFLKCLPRKAAVVAQARPDVGASDSASASAPFAVS